MKSVWFFGQHFFTSCSTMCNGNRGLDRRRFVSRRFEKPSLSLSSIISVQDAAIIMWKNCNAKNFVRAQSLGLRLAVIEVTESILEMEAAAPGADVELMCKTLQVDHKFFTLTLRKIPVVTTLRFLRRHQGQGPPSLCPWQELCGLLICLITMQMVRIQSFSARSYSSIPRWYFLCFID